MTDTNQAARTDEVVGEIKVIVTGEGIQVDSGLPIPEVVFWLECAKTLVVGNFLDKGDDPR